MFIVLGVIAVLLTVIAGLLWSAVNALHRLEGVLPAARIWLDEVEQKENMKRADADFERRKIQEQWEEEAFKKRKETPGCQVTSRGGGMRYVLPGELDYQYSVPFEDYIKVHFVLCNAGFENHLKDTGFWAYVKTRQPGQWISGQPVPTQEEVRNACQTLKTMGYLEHKSGEQVIELVDSIYEGYPHKKFPSKPKK